MKNSIAVFSALALIALVLALVFFWRGGREEIFAGRPLIVTTTYPLAYAAEYLAGDDAQVLLLLPSGADPHSFSPRPSDITILRRADLILYNGAGLDAWIEQTADNLNLPSSRLVEAASLVNLLETEEHEEYEHEEEDDHGVFDPHFWLDPVVYAAFAQAFSTRLAELAPESSANFTDRQQRLADELKQLDAEFEQAFAICDLNKIIVAHDAFNYLASRYGFELIAISGISPQEEPSVRRLAQIAQLARDHQINVVFFENTVSPRLAQAIAAEVGASTDVLHTLENLTAGQVADGEDYLSLMRENRAHLVEAMRCLQ